MGRGAPVVLFIGLTGAFIAVPSCGGDRIRLGDVVAGSSANIAGDDATERAGAGNTSGGAAGRAGSAGSAGNHAGSGGNSGNQSGGSGGCDGASSVAGCQRGAVKADEVLWIGDTWVTFPGIQHTRVSELARASCAIGMSGDDYVVLAGPATFMADIADQYATRQAGTTKVKVLIMDGGTWDTLQANGSDASVDTAASGFQELLDTVASDGTVEHIIYFLPPELPRIAGVAALRPRVQQACRDSRVPCYFLDLQPYWAGHPEYTDGSGIQASGAGAKVIAEQIWDIMQQNCIAQ